jgi:cyclic beta-1,2-glucan synthetase
MILELNQSLSGGRESSGDTPAWWIAETGQRLNDLRAMTEHLTPWLLPEHAPRLECLGPDAERNRIPCLTLESLPQVIADLDARLESVTCDQTVGIETQSAGHALRSLLPSCLAEAESLQNRLRAVAEEAATLVDQMDFRFLYSQRRKAFSIGYHVRDGRLEESCYELLASEARTAAFVAIAKGDAPQETWFRLGRAHTFCEGGRVLLSWTGTMFEYLMPILWMKAYQGTILEENARAAVRCQRQAGRRLGIPWGMSEAACTERDGAGHYQYYPFGVRALALKTELPPGLVVSPYSSFLALMVEPVAALKNLQIMADMGWVGQFGFYESAEFAGHETLQSKAPEIVRCWMAHHQGMILLSVCNLLSDCYMQNLFHQEPRVAATERILHERVPLAAPVEPSFY